MRPSLLDPLFASVQSLKGIGPRFAVFIAKLSGPLVVDLLWHRPFRVIDRSASPHIMRAEPGQMVTLEVTVESIQMGKHSQPSRVRVNNKTGFMDIVYFKAYEATLEKQFPIGEQVVISGTFDDFNGKKQITHPDYVLPVSRRDEIPKVEPVYNLTAGLPSKSLRKTIGLALQRLPELPEWIDADYLKKQNWPVWKQAVLKLHNPQSDIECGPQNPARCRLAYDELLANQLALALTREKTRVLKGRSLIGDGHLQKQLIQQLPFALTNSQKEAIKEISTDMQSGDRMLRMLQGDVGSGKTLVALMAMLQAVESGAQACLMVPT
ncbi:MAG: ATP-dependent DNA helicase RecG, partial [Alphaproteobacteria bacterium]|nr:ATP-dependent DNA helicase RecG [Alphaproteobacteria bacterium]